MDYIWQAKYEIEPTLTSPEKINGIDFQVMCNKTTVIVEHITNNYNDITNTECKEYIEILRNYMLRKMLFQKDYQPIKIKLSHPPILLNREELKEKGAKLTRTIRVAVSQPYSLLEGNGSLLESEQIWLLAVSSG